MPYGSKTWKVGFNILLCRAVANSTDENLLGRAMEGSVLAIPAATPAVHSTSTTTTASARHGLQEKWRKSC